METNALAFLTHMYICELRSVLLYQKNLVGLLYRPKYQILFHRIIPNFDCSTYNETQLHQIHQPHGMVHIDLQCTMEPTQTAAYDPIFWLHHSFIDKVWAERQNNPDLPQMTSIDLEDNILEPFGGNY